MQDKEEKENLLDFKGTIEKFIEEEPPELTQEEAIKSYKENGMTKKRKNHVASEDEDENEDDEHLKRVKQELLASLERVDKLAKKLFEEKGKESIKGIKVKSRTEISKDREQIMEKMREKVQENREKSREE